MEEVFLTHLEMEFPEFKHILASVRGKLGAYVDYFNFINCFLFVFCMHVCDTQCVCTHTYMDLCTNLFFNIPVSKTEKQKQRSSGEVCGAVVSMNYKKVNSFC